MIILTPMPAERHWVRIAGAQAFITVKGRSRGVTRLEFEYPIPLAYAGHMLDELCERPLVEKTRHTLDIGPQRWEIDEFHGDNQGLIVAEIELQHEALAGFALRVLTGHPEPPPLI